MDRHVTALGVVYIASGILGCLIGLFLFWVIAGSGLLSGNPKGMAVTSIVATVLAGTFALFSIPEIIAGIGLLKRRPWSRILTLILGVLSLLEIPIGTAVGIYTLWVLLKPEAAQFFQNPDVANQAAG